MEDNYYEEVCKETEEKLKAIGQEIIDKASEIAQDLKDVMSITVHGEIKPNTLATLEITKEFRVINSEKIII